MRKHNWTRTLAATAAFGLLGGADAVAPTNAERRITVTVHRVKQLNNLDADLPLEHDDADFYALIWIDGQQFKTKNFSDDDGRPYWTITGRSNKSAVPIRIRLMDDDGGLEDNDDHVDINPYSGEKDIMFTYRPGTGRISGHVNGRKNRIMKIQGYGENQKGMIAFSVE